MFDNIENLKIISIAQKANKPYVKIVSRKTHSFFIRLSGSMLYDFGDRKIISNTGELVFVPKGSSYEAWMLSENTGYTAIHFDGNFKSPPEPISCSLDKFYDAEYMSSNISDMWNFGNSAEQYKCISLFYGLLSYLAIEEGAKTDKHAYTVITPALDYLKKHIYDPSLKVDKLPRLCGISGTYFRQLFESIYATTPHRYILAKRLSHAKSIIAGGDYDTIAEVALLVGFNDPLYFSKVYKKAYGVSPSDDCHMP